MADENNNEFEMGERSKETTDLTSDSVLGKHIDMAIEAQDGKPQTSTDGTDATSAEQEDGTAKQSEQKDRDKDSTGDKKDSAAQSKPDKEGKKDEKHSAGPKDLVVDGKVVAKGGAERRFYEAAQIAKQEVAHVRSQLTQAQKDAQEARQQLQTVQQSVQAVNGMAPQELAVASRLFNDMKRDPSGTLKKLLAEAVASGYSIEGIGAGIDVAAITAAVKAELANQPTAKDAEEIEVANVEKEVATFFGQYPDAKPHDALIARFVRDNPGVGLDTAYFQLKNAFAERGLDWNLPLEWQLEAGVGKSQEAQQKQSDAKALPNGREVAGNADPIKDTPIAHESADMGDIVREAMRENGLQV